MILILLFIQMSACSTIKGLWKGADTEDMMDSQEEEIAFNEEESEESFEEDALEENSEGKDPASEDTAEIPTEQMPAEEMDTPSEGGMAVYTVKKGETLMWIAYKLYGDYKRWRELESQNQAVLSNGLKEGIQLAYKEENFQMETNGTPYLIMPRDTLGTISKDKYGSSRKWKDIWQNNRRMITNPNLIFAGFTLYYIP